MIAARPTTYNGIPMRSRLEARFAADLDAEGSEWIYEPRAYANADGQYLPDFQITKTATGAQPQPTFIEVRPTIEGAYRAMAQMPVIWDSEPDALLLVVAPDLWLWWSRLPTRRSWRMSGWG